MKKYSQGHNNNHYLEDTGQLMTKPKGVSKGVYIALAVSVLLVLTIAVIGIKFIGGDQSGKTNVSNISKDIDKDAMQDSGEKKAEEDSSDMPATKSDDYKSAYAEVLLDNEEAIKAYWWQSDAGNNPVNGYQTNNSDNPSGLIVLPDPKNKCVVIEDLDGDGVPELLFFAAISNFEAILHAYHYTDGQAREYGYDTSMVVNRYLNMNDGKLLVDRCVAAGTKYMLYTGREPGTFYAGLSFGDMTMSFEIIEYHVGNDVINAVHDTRNSFSYEPDEEKDIYYYDNEQIKFDDGVKLFANASKDLNNLLMFSGYEKEMSLFEKVKSDSAKAMTYYEALSLMQNR